MDAILNFLADYYLYFMIGAVVLLFALIGFIVDGKRKKKKEEIIQAGPTTNGMPSQPTTSDENNQMNVVQGSGETVVEEPSLVIEEPSLNGTPIEGVDENGNVVAQAEPTLDFNEPAQNPAPEVVQPESIFNIPTAQEPVVSEPVINNTPVMEPTPVEPTPVEPTPVQTPVVEPTLVPEVPVTPTVEVPQNNVNQ